ncbi:hypothetical protein K469DRAFT_687286 [Zopfia rhizophila CBS 207.26]|uniref:Uncharacterized protein n=1 Tax=Zopfia rhizophila CBS 207.26 TaxID=1314779 RepID=A0A6A6E6B8_9PEZI|nr:hypothetical protein K469DRAFT_687286 [Zopfia rhizophila CBS 207.26]
MCIFIAQSEVLETSEICNTRQHLDMLGSLNKEEIELNSIDVRYAPSSLLRPKRIHANSNSRTHEPIDANNYPSGKAFNAEDIARTRKPYRPKNKQDQHHTGQGCLRDLGHTEQFRLFCGLFFSWEIVVTTRRRIRGRGREKAFRLTSSEAICQHRNQNSGLEKRHYVFGSHEIIRSGGLDSENSIVELGRRDQPSDDTTNLAQDWTQHLAPINPVSYTLMSMWLVVGHKILSRP